MNIKELNKSLLIACEKGNLNVVKKLVKLGAEVNFKIGDTGYHYLGLSDEANLAYFFGFISYAGENHLQCFEYLISKGLDINKKVEPFQVDMYRGELSCEVCTPIQFAVMKQNIFTLKKLLKHNADLSFKNSKNENVLNLAVKCIDDIGEDKNFGTEYSYLIIKMLVDKLYNNSKENNVIRKQIKNKNQENELIK